MQTRETTSPSFGARREEARMTRTTITSGTSITTGTSGASAVRLAQTRTQAYTGTGV